ncbi:MAG: sigma-54-dependent Fis family transcriptional regulator [Leptonema sp. (in: Bacteria)]|nr:sigma-54-dependent Fis family transcriptional regulator [Leptonema sp. (in: bacteria)]
MALIHLIEDDPVQRDALKEFIEITFGKQEKLKVIESDSVKGAITTYSRQCNDINIILSDLKLPDGTGIEFLKYVREHDSSIPFLFLTGQPEIESAVEALQNGASDYLTKPIDLLHLQKKLQSYLQNIRLERENRTLRIQLSGLSGRDKIIGNSSRLLTMMERASQVAPTDVTVLIEGESGTGKELVANFLHENSSRSSHPFIKVNCGALTKSILESELFGVSRGAYTGADKDRAGLFEAASGGTIFLDEIGELDLESQIRLLRVLEDRTVTRLGSTRSIEVDVRVITATNRDLLKEVDTGRFREDLYYRLAILTLKLPALRERIDDIPLLFNHFVIQFNERYGKSVTNLSPDLLNFFNSYDWPGNIRQFRNVIEAMVILAKDDLLTKNDLPEEILRAPSSHRNLIDTIIAGVSMDDYEKAIIQKNLAFTSGKRDRTASLLGISERTLYRKIQRYELS